MMSTALILGSLVFSASAMLSGEMPCNLTTEYPIQKNSKILGCVSCPTCTAGFEPSIPCGTTVGNNEVLGECKECNDGTFSNETNQKSCQECQDTSCLEHEIVKKNCPKTYDASPCTGHCEDGYVMNTEKTECETDLGIIPMSITTTVLPKTAEEHNKESSQMPGWLISVTVVVIVFILVLGILAAFICHKRRDKRVNEVSPLPLINPKYLSDGDNGSSSSTELLGRNREHVRQGIEDCSANVTASRPHCPETSGGYAMSTTAASNNVSCNGYTRDILSDHGQLQFDMEVRASKPGLVKSPVPASLAPPTLTAQQIPPVVNPPRPVHVASARNNAQPMVQNNVIHNRAPDMMRFESWPKKIYDEICRKINNSVAPGKDWEALVGKLDFSVEAARDFEKQKNKTDALLSSWMMERENNVAKFIEVLNDMRMTVLADYINGICETNGY